MKKLIAIFSIIVFISSCSKSDPKPPVAATLLAPENNAECILGTDSGNTQKEITFSWQASAHTDSYILTVKNLNTGATDTYTTNQTDFTAILDKTVPYSWYVTSQNNKVAETAESETYKFYVAGNAITNYAPFPADLLAPTAGTTIENGNDVSLVWKGSDVENEIAYYQVYLDTKEVPENTIINATTATKTKVSGLSQGIYYWKVITFDDAGNSSVSPVFSFKID